MNEAQRVKVGNGTSYRDMELPGDYSKSNTVWIDDLDGLPEVYMLHGGRTYFYGTLGQKDNLPEVIARNDAYPHITANGY